MSRGIGVHCLMHIPQTKMIKERESLLLSHISYYLKLSFSTAQKPISGSYLWSRTWIHNLKLRWDVIIPFLRQFIRVEGDLLPHQFCGFWSDKCCIHRLASSCHRMLLLQAVTGFLPPSRETGSTARLSGWCSICLSSSEPRIQKNLPQPLKISLEFTAEYKMLQIQIQIQL